MSEQERVLWEAFQRGSASAFEEILRIYYRPMFDYGLNIQRDHDLLSDHIHDLFISIWERRAFLKPSDNLKLYLFSALRNQIIRAKSRRFTPTELNEESEETHQEEEYAELAIIREETMDEKLSRIQFVMQKLSPRQQEVLHLRFFDNLSNEQISKVLDISEPAVYNLLSLSLKLFRKYWTLYFAISLLPYLITHL